MDGPDWQFLFNFAVAFIGFIGAMLLGIIAWLVSRALDRQAAQEKELAEFKTHVAENYLPRVEHSAALNRIEKLIREQGEDFNKLTTRLFERLDEKQEKT